MDPITGLAVGMVIGMAAVLVVALMRGRLYPETTVRTGDVAVLAVALAAAAASLPIGRPDAGLLAAAAGVLGLVVAQWLRRGPDVRRVPPARGRGVYDGDVSLLFLLIPDL